MTRTDWPSIKRDYVETTMTLAEIEAKWNVPRGTLSARATRQSWHDQKQQFAAKLEAAQRKKSIAKRAADQDQFDNAVFKVAKIQLSLIARQMHGEDTDAAKLLKLANALEKLQRIGFTAFGGLGTSRTGSQPGDNPEPYRQG